MLLLVLCRPHCSYRAPCFCLFLLALHVRILYSVSKSHYHQILTFIFVLTVAGLASFVAKEILPLMLHPCCCIPIGSLDGIWRQCCCLPACWFVVLFGLPASLRVPNRGVNCGVLFGSSCSNQAATPGVNVTVLFGLSIFDLVAKLRVNFILSPRSCSSLVVDC